MMHLQVFSIWSMLSTLVGAFLMSKQPPIIHFAGMMTLTWGIVNLLVSLALYFNIRHHRYLKQSPSAQLRIQHHVEKMFAFNVGLDLAYTAIGGCMFFFSQHGTALPELWNGFGIAILIQGISMTSFDAISHWLHCRNRRNNANFYHN